MTSIENEVDDFYERASWPLGTRVRIIGGDKGLVGSLVRRCARNWVDRNRKLPMVRWDGKIDAVEVSWDCLKRVVGDEAAMIETIQTLAERASSFRAVYGDGDGRTYQALNALFYAISISEHTLTTLVVEPGTLVKYGRGLGIYVRADYNDSQFDTQPFVTINVEDMNPACLYDPATGQRGDVGNKDASEPIINVMLNDVTLYDDEGKGEVNTEILHEVYVVAPDDRTSEPPAVFEYQLDAEAYASTFTDPPAVERTTIAGHVLATEMIADRQDDDDEEFEREVPCIRRKHFGGEEVITLTDFAQYVIQDDDEALIIVKRMVGSKEPYPFNTPASGAEPEFYEEFEVADLVELLRQITVREKEETS